MKVSGHLLNLRQLRLIQGLGSIERLGTIFQDTKMRRQTRKLFTNRLDRLAFPATHINKDGTV